MELLELRANARLRAEGHAEVIREELLGGRLYTGPMYQKYNAVLRGYGDAPGSTFLADTARKLTRGNSRSVLALRPEFLDEAELSTEQHSSLVLLQARK